jgi:hypothetical protein
VSEARTLEVGGQRSEVKGQNHRATEPQRTECQRPELKDLFDTDYADCPDSISVARVIRPSAVIGALHIIYRG